ncbi:thioredoxin family protein [Aureivirga marina]|uniref:thioredoxin family protein n=1 Tax=Aureivirga marina TaxID=1182451 RepID=UPI001E53CD06|nr:thioredoxin family protein [Aureivirga marina]
MLIVVSLLPLLAFSQIKTTTFEQIDSIQKTNPRNIIVFIHTDWCKYCQSMKQTTFKNKKVAQKLNNHFWFIDFNAEEKRDIEFVGHTFKFKPTGRKTGIHELAEQLGTINGKIAYPTLCILNEKYEIIFQYNQFLSEEDLLKVLGGVLKK